MVSQNDYIGCAAAARYASVDGKPVSPSTPFRWMTDGLRGVRLKHVRMGRRFATKAAWLDEFFAAVAEAERPARPVAAVATPTTRTSKQRERDIQRAEAELAAAGVIS